MDEAAEVARVPELAALLREMDELRLALDSDLSVAAAAAEAGQPGLAAQVLAAGRDDVLRFEQHALARLHSLADEPEPPDADAEVALRPVRISRTLLRLAPLAAAAAGVLGLALLVHPASAPVRSVAPAGSTASGTGVLASWATVADLVAGAAPPAQVSAAARAMHEQVAALLPAAAADPATARTVLQMLLTEQAALQGAPDAGQLQGALATSRRLADRLVAVLPDGTGRLTAFPDGPSPLPAGSEPAVLLAPVTVPAPPGASGVSRTDSSAPNQNPAGRTSTEPRPDEARPAASPPPASTSPSGHRLGSPSFEPSPWTPERNHHSGLGDALGAAARER